MDMARIDISLYDILSAHLMKRTRSVLNVHAIKLHCYFMKKEGKNFLFATFYTTRHSRHTEKAGQERHWLLRLSIYYITMAFIVTTRSYLRKWCSSPLESDENLLQKQAT